MAILITDSTLSIENLKMIDLMAAGIIDPTGAVRCSLKHAAFGAKLLVELILEDFDLEI